MSFRLWTILYVFALFAAGMATFGWIGVVPCACVLFLWKCAYSADKSVHAVGCLFFVAVAVLLGSLLLPKVNSATQSSPQSICRNNLRQLALALGQYESRHGSFPPATIRDELGNPLFSWRTEILPFIEETDLYNAIDHKLAWDAPANRASTAVEMPMFTCPSEWDSAASSGCNYFAVVGPHTAWPEGDGRPLGEITDPKSQTILLMEATNRGVPWAKPGDLTFDEAVQILTGEVEWGLHPEGLNRDFFYRTLHKATPGINIAMVDGSVHFLARPLPRDVAIALLTIDGGERISETQLDQRTEPELDWPKVCGLCVFVFLSLLPIAFLHRRGTQQLPAPMSQP